MTISAPDLPVVVDPQHLSKTFTDFFNSERSGGILLIWCTAAALLLANSAVGPGYLGLWQTQVGALTVQHWINDALMALFFLLIGLELERELYVGELSNPRDALLPILAAIGGMAAPAMIHLAFNAGTPAQAGFGIPMATDIAFALGVLALLGTRIPPALKVFVVAFAVMDDLGAIVIIAVFYTAQLSVWHLAGGAAVWALLIALNRAFRVMSLAPYLLGGALMWLMMLKSGVHPTIAGVALAFAIPFSATNRGLESPSNRLERLLSRPVAFLVLPVFALANTGVVVGADWMDNLTSANGLGIISGLLIGKPLGVTLLCLAAVGAGLCRLPGGLNWRHIVGAGVLGGIGFTMSVFITNLAFAGDAETVNVSVMAVLAASVTAGIVGFLWLRLSARAPAAGGPA